MTSLLDAARRPGLPRVALALLALLLAVGWLPFVLGRADAAVGPDVQTPDPSAVGTLGSTRAEYDLPKVAVGVGAPGATGSTILQVRVAGDVHYPTRGAGPFPVLVFQHGNHATCESGSVLDDQLVLGGPGSLASYADGDCSTSNATADQLLQIQEAASFRGYDYLAERLATQGYIVVSIDVNDITAWGNNAAESGYVARAQVIAKTLDLVGSWGRGPGPAGIGSALVGRVGLDKGVGVMGHSRGGEGVNMFAEYNLTRPATTAEAAARRDPEDATRAQPVPDVGPRYDLRAVFSLAPVDGQGGRFPVVRGTNWATLLPYCDGDVFNLQGAPVFERSAAGLSRTGYGAAQYLVNGANHNYFNTVWTADDANLFGLGDPSCNAAAAPTRLQPREERQIGLTLIGGFLRYWVGGETQFAPIVQGASLPPAACPNEGDDPAAGVTCRDVVQTSWTAPRRRELVVPGGTASAPTVPTSTPAGDPITTAGLTVTACVPAAAVVTTTGCGSSPNRSAGPQLGVAWTASPATLSVAPRGAQQDLSGFGTLSFRVSPNFTSPQQLPVETSIDVRLTDAAGRSATVASRDWSSALEPAAGTTARKQVLNGVRIPLSAFTGVDLRSVTGIVLGFGTSATPTGSVQLDDVVLQEPGVVAEPTPPTATVTVSPTSTATATQTVTTTAPEPTETVTQTITASPTSTATATQTVTTTAPQPTETVTQTVTASPTATQTATATATVTAPDPTQTVTVTQTASPTATQTATATTTASAPSPTPISAAPVQGPPPVGSASRTRTRIRLPQPVQRVAGPRVRLLWQVVAPRVSTQTVGTARVEIDDEVVATYAMPVTGKVGRSVRGLSMRVPRSLRPGRHQVQVFFTPTDPAAWTASSSRRITLTVLGSARSNRR